MSWESQTLDGPASAVYFDAARQRQESREADTHTIRRIGLIGALGGGFLSIVSSVAALVVYNHTPTPEPPGYILIDKATGWISEPTTVRDAPRLFPETVRARAIRDFLLACESYIPQSWIRIDWHACMIQADPAEQKRRNADIGRDGPRYPPKLFGPGGYAMPVRFDEPVLRGQQGTEPNIVWDYQVHYVRVEVANGHEASVAYTGRITFAFHPDLRMTPEDRRINPSGFQALSFSTWKD